MTQILKLTDILDVSKSATPLADAEIFAPEIDRISDVAGSHPEDLERLKVVYGSEARHLVIHDVYAASWWADIDGGLLYDVTVYNLGWWSSDSNDSRNKSETGHGWTIYSQNGAENKPKVIDACMFIAGFEGGKILATGTDKVHHYRLSRSILVGKGFMFGGKAYGADDIVIDDCAFLDCRLNLGYVAANGEATVQGCLFGQYDNQCLSVGSTWESITFENNTLASGASRIVTIAPSITLETVRSWKWNGNKYYSTSEKPFTVGNKAMTFAEWQAVTGLDADSQFFASEPPLLMRVYPVPEKNAANVAVINAPNLETIPLSDLFASVTATPVVDTAQANDLQVALAKADATLAELREKVERGESPAVIRDGRNYDVAYSGKELIMSGEVKPPIGWAGSATEAPLWRATFPRYGAFRIEMLPKTSPLPIEIPEPIETPDQKTIRELRADVDRLTGELAAATAATLDATQQRDTLAAQVGEQQQIIDGLRDRVNAAEPIAAALSALIGLIVPSGEAR